MNAFKVLSIPTSYIEQYENNLAMGRTEILFKQGQDLIHIKYNFISFWDLAKKNITYICISEP